MLLPTFFESPEADYPHLKKHVQVWDLACNRQAQLRVDVDREFGPVVMMSNRPSDGGSF